MQRPGKRLTSREVNWVTYMATRVDTAKYIGRIADQNDNPAGVYTTQTREQMIRLMQDRMSTTFKTPPRGHFYKIFELQPDGTWRLVWGEKIIRRKGKYQHTDLLINRR